jgi:hypothetical protein
MLGLTSFALSHTCWRVHKSQDIIFTHKPWTQGYYKDIEPSWNKPMLGSFLIQYWIFYGFWIS